MAAHTVAHDTGAVVADSSSSTLALSAESISGPKHAHKSTLQASNDFSIASVGCVGQVWPAAHLIV
jgi:hypothetical protein